MQPMSSVVFHRSIGSADRAEVELLAQAARGSIEFPLQNPTTIRLSGSTPSHTQPSRTMGDRCSRIRTGSPVMLQNYFC